jgi:ElaB/YqjD/DUF883 family membrane-anchored ribosome-binding protein
MYWLARHTLNDLLQTMLAWKSPTPASQVRILTDAIAHLSSHPESFTAELTPSEQVMSHGWDLLQPITVNLILGPTHAHAAADLKAATAALSAWLTTDLPTALYPAAASTGPSCILPHHTRLHTLYLHLEFLKAALRLVDAAAALAKQKAHHAHSKIPADALEGVRKAVREQGESVRRRAREMKKRLERGGADEVLAAFRSGGAVGEAVAGLVGEQRMKRYARAFVESAVEAVDGVLKVKV